MVAGVLHHLTTIENLKRIQRVGAVEPRDPAPKQWAGLAAVFLSDPTDPLYQRLHTDVLLHVREKHEKVVRLHIRTRNALWRAYDQEGTMQIVSLAPIPIQEVLYLEDL